MKPNKPLGHKSYGSIPHLPGSRQDRGDKGVNEGQNKILTVKTRDKYDDVIVQEKLDGGNVGVAKINGEIVALTRSGYEASTSQYITHHAFEKYVRKNESRFFDLLSENERICGEWLLTAVGSKYKLDHEPFVAFDIISDRWDRICFQDFVFRMTSFNFPIPQVVHTGPACSILQAKEILPNSAHGADKLEGYVWRCERKGKVDFMAKYVNPDKIDGIYLEEVIYNEMPKEFNYLLP